MENEMHGTMVSVVETVSALTDAEVHKKAVDKAVSHGLAGGLSVHSATTTATSTPPPHEPMIIRVTTIVFGA